MASIVSCRWDWCRSSFSSIDALDTHVKHEHIWPMNPMRKADVTLMRRMDLQSLHSSLDTDSSIASRGLFAATSRSKAPPPTAPLASTPRTPKRLENEGFDTFTHQSSPQALSPQSLPPSPAIECLMKQDGPSEFSAAVEALERNHGCKGNLGRLPSPACRPSSLSPGSSQEVVEQQLTQEEDVTPAELHIDDISDPELVWPTDAELAAVEIGQSEQSALEHNKLPDSSPSSARDQIFGCGSMDVPSDTNGYSARPSTGKAVSHADSQESDASSQPLILQTQAPYSSQALGWSQSQ